MHSFDLDCAVRKQMKGHYPTSTLPFLSQPPAKVIFHAMESVRAEPAVITRKRSLEDISPDTHRPSKLARAVTNAIESTFGAAPSNTPSPQPNPSAAPTSNKPVSPNIGVAGTHDDASTAQAKAARADDAPVDEDGWNARAAQGTFPDGYDNSLFSTQRRGFDAVRTLMMRFYNRNLHNSFARY